MAVQPARASSVAVTRWQYTCTSVSGFTAVVRSVAEDKRNELDQLGADGWEWAGRPDDNFICFKRPY